MQELWSNTCYYAEFYYNYAREMWGAVRVYHYIVLLIVSWVGGVFLLKNSTGKAY